MFIKKDKEKKVVVVEIIREVNEEMKNGVLY